MLTRNELICTINKLAAERQSFVFIIDFKGEKGFVFPDNEETKQVLRYSIEDVSSPKAIPEFEWQIQPMPYPLYEQKFNYVRNQIQQGNSFLVNLTQPTPIKTNLTPEAIFNHAQARYKVWFKNQFIALSPETFVRINDGRISSYPMKGTIDASIPNAKQQLLNDAKEKAEHATIVDLIRNDLSIVASKVEVTRYRYIDHLQTNRGELLQVSSEISGELPENYHAQLGDILFKLLPAGSISGAPKPKTLEIIETAETYERGFYTGIFGKFDGTNLDSAVLIRFIELIDNQFVFKSGGGITAQSNCHNEYNELIHKIYVPIY